MGFGLEGLRVQGVEGAKGMEGGGGGGVRSGVSRALDSSLFKLRAQRQRALRQARSFHKHLSDDCVHSAQPGATSPFVLSGVDEGTYPEEFLRAEHKGLKV